MREPEATLRDRVRRFAAAVEERGTPLYAHLARAAADDDLALALLGSVPDTGPAHPTILFAAVHDRVLAGDAPALEPWYPTVGGRTSVAEADPWPAFRTLLGEQRDALEHILRTRRTQTNEIGRTTAVLLALREVERDVGQPLAWLDLGSAAGLGLAADRYAHDLGDGRTLGPPDSPVQLACEVRDAAPPVDRLPTVAWRQGLDAAPVDLRDAAARRWLLACVWPEQLDRAARLRAALELVAPDPPAVHRGKLPTDLPVAIDGVPDDAHLVLTHTWVMAYLDASARAELETHLDAAGAARDLDRIGMEAGGVLPGTPRREPAAPALLLRSRWRDGRRSDELLGEVEDHGRWMRWGPPGS